MNYKNKMDDNIAEATKNICCEKGECAVDHYTVTRWFNQFDLVSKSPDDLSR